MRRIDTPETHAPPRSRPAAPPVRTIDVSVCIAHWNARDYLRDCLASLEQSHPGLEVETIVVDNGSTDGSAEMVRDEFPGVRLIRNAENFGFARACNQAARVAGGEYLFFLNNDTVLAPGATRELFDYLDARPEVGMAGPRLIGGDGQTQTSWRGGASLKALLHRTLWLRWTGLWAGHYRRYRRGGLAPGEGARAVEALLGAAVMIRRDRFRRLGGWDEKFPFGGEDLDLSRRVNREAMVTYVPSAEVTHFGRVSSRRNIGWVVPAVALGHVHSLRAAGVSELGVCMYKLAVTSELPLHLLAKATQALGRLIGGRADAARSWEAFCGVWGFVRGGLWRLWRA